MPDNPLEIICENPKLHVVLEKSTLIIFFFSFFFFFFYKFILLLGLQGLPSVSPTILHYIIMITFYLYLLIKVIIETCLNHSDI